MKWLLLLLLACCVIFWLRRRTPARTKQAKNQTGMPATGNGSAFKAVSIKPGKGACAEAKALANSRYLQTDAPALPLPGCTSTRCDCHYSYHPDRRTDEDRRAPYSIRTDLYGSAEETDRRQTPRDRRRN